MKVSKVIALQSMEKGLSINRIKFIRSLSVAKYRRKHQSFVAEGPKIVKELLESSFQVREVYALKTWLEETGAEDSFGQSKFYEVGEEELKKISNLHTPNQVLALTDIPHQKPVDRLPFDDLILALDAISDPGNMGTIIRTADWFGIEHIICSRECVDVFNPKVVQATMGSIARVKIYYHDLKEVIFGFRNKTTVYATVRNGQNIYERKLSANGLILIGNESRGLNQELIDLSHHQVSIPAQSGSSAESLNASVAAAIIMSEFRRS